MGLSYRSALTQVVILGFICFCCPGMFNALNSMGGGGQIDSSTGSKANTALYVTFTIFGLLGGAIVNIIGVRLSLCVSGLTYALYSGSYVYYNNTQNSWFTVAAGAILGIGAGVLWAGQGMIMTSYPLEKDKGKYISVFWVIFNLGGMLGSIIPIATGKSSESLPTSGYIAFLVLECFGSFLALALAPPSKVIRSDGSNVVISAHGGWGDEVRKVIGLFGNKRMILILFMSFSSNFFYSYQFNYYNGRNFTTDSKGFNSIFYWGSQMIGSVLIGFVLDSKMSRKTRAYIGTTIVVVFFNLVWLLTHFEQKRLTKIITDNGNITDSEKYLRLDYKTSGKTYAWPIILYAFMGLADAIWQNLAYWLIGAMSNDSTVLSRYVGFYKSIQSFGGAISWAIDVAKMSMTGQFIFNWVVLDLSVPFMFYLCSITTETSEEPEKPDYEDKS
ncbi:UNC93-like protein 2 [Zancudomyces culisetae]|uniref:UNC93-like protein 2 n=1 Tax=Zancudomyces culisetae TaxID=1213189 RepID=A0A1R1PX54_ZANCU|nr:UNC93-like protein 2 [Zancudomyces culisetae]|eukprot:OMH85529.1 UNC93-like protein 2 [Zancudomyces culisetae]